ncbi:alkene reductase [Frondihabitans cladoniiphilus]|uniref:Alkene reductase n=1 Tax=Frondihabitans cladoniiphilus TaxID=715785 RepID=A0ABP8WCG4_9MICO
MTELFSPFSLGRLELPHHFVMAPMTRNRANPDGVPGEFTPEYYAQRASLGLLITEGTQPNADGQGYVNTPGIYTDEHVAGWRRVTDALHDAGAATYVQLMHAGRIAHVDNTPHHRQPVAPSAIASGTDMYTPSGKAPTSTPRALTTAEVEQTVQDFRHAAASAIAAGADGVEIHGANNYLVQQFFAPNANERTDQYGGSIENRARFALEVAAAVADEIGADRTGFRISPGSQGGGLDEGPSGNDLYRHLVGSLNDLGLAYLHVFHFGDDELLADLRSLWKQPLLVLRGGRQLDEYERDLASGLADGVPVGHLALANPDFVERYRAGAPMNDADVATFFNGGAHGYVDYPTLSAAAGA